jgi:flagellar assembly protein FliH
MAAFEAPQFDLNTTGTSLEKDARVTQGIKNQEPQPMVVQEFELKKLKATSGAVLHPSSQSVGQSLGRSASARAQALAQSVSRDRFKLSQLAKEAQGEEEKERRQIDAAIQSRVQAESEMARAIGLKEGYVEGLNQGRQEALEQYRKSSSEKVERLDQLVSSMEAAKIQIFEANQKFLVDLAYRVGRSVLLKELATDREYVTRLARGLLEKIELRDNLTLKLNPSDAALVDELKAGLQGTFANLRNLAIETSSEVRGGGVVLESEWGAIDASLETQLSSLRAALQSSTRQEG